MAVSRESSLNAICARQESLFNPVAITRTFARVKTMQRCMELTRSGQLPTLKAMARVEGNREHVLSLIVCNLVALNAFMHLKNGMTEAEMEYCAGKILEDYGGALSFADLHLVMDNIKSGKYGRMYERMGAADILAWVDDWYNARLGEAECGTMSDHRPYEAVPRLPSVKERDAIVLRDAMKRVEERLNPKDNEGGGAQEPPQRQETAENGANAPEAE